MILLPYPTRIVCDVVREWPYLLFLATGFFLLIWGAKYGKWWVLVFVGLSSGLGYLIRPESAQLVVYGFLWVVLSVFSPKLWGVVREKALIGLMLLLIGFAIPTVPYMKCMGKIIPPKVNNIIKHFSLNKLPDKTEEPKAKWNSSNYNTAEMAPPLVLKAIGEIFKTIGETLMWFFMPALVIGLYCRFRGNVKREELFLITTFVLVSLAMLIFQYCYCRPHISQRWSLPLVVFTVFYIPVGLHVIGNRLESKLSTSRPKTNTSKGNRSSWFSVLLLVGICICLPKLLRPIRIAKQDYRDTAQWLKGNTAATDIIAVPDRRISFYAERKGVLFADGRIPRNCEYAIKQFQSQGEMFLYGVKMKDRLSLEKNWRSEKNAIAIYRRVD